MRSGQVSRRAGGAAARWLIIGAALLAVSACSTVRLGYNQGPTLGMWWLDRWLGLSAEQKAALRPAVAAWFDWHRATQLPTYAQRLADWGRRAGGELQPTEICAAFDELRGWAWKALEATVPATAARLPELTDAQWARLTQRQAERLDELRREHLPGSPEAGQAAALKRAVDRSQELYGRLDEAQRALLARGLADAPVGPQDWITDRERRQQRLVERLRGAQALGETQRAQAVRTAWRDFLEPDPTTADWRRQWQAHQCELAARLHNSTTPAQRQRLQQRLAGFEQDFSVLAAAAGQ